MGGMTGCLVVSRPSPPRVTSGRHTRLPTLDTSCAKRTADKTGGGIWRNTTDAPQMRESEITHDVRALRAFPRAGAPEHEDNGGVRCGGGDAAAGRRRDRRRGGITHRAWSARRRARCERNERRRGEPECRGDARRVVSGDGFPYGQPRDGGASFVDGCVCAADSGGLCERDVVSSLGTGGQVGTEPPIASARLVMKAKHERVIRCVASGTGRITPGFGNFRKHTSAVLLATRRSSVRASIANGVAHTRCDRP